MPLAFGTVTFYIPNTTTPKDTWQDEAQTILNTNPIALDAAGRAVIWGSGSYRQIVKDVNNNLIWDKVTTDPVQGLQASIATVQTNLTTFIANLAASAGASLVGFIQAGVGAIAQTVQAVLREKVTVTNFGAICDGVTDDSAAIQKAVNYCATSSRWKTLVIPGRCFVASSVNIDRLVDNTLSDFLIVGRGPGAGFYTTGNVTVFDSTLPMTTAPVSEFIRFKNILFETSSIANNSYAISQKFLRCYFEGCRFALMRCQISSIYVQTLYFTDCNIRNTAVNFINAVGLYDVLFKGCIIENGSTLVRSVDLSRGTNGLRLIGNVIEGIQASIIVGTGFSGFVYESNHCEGNFSPEINTFAGTLLNHSLKISGNYIYNPGGPTFYHGPTNYVVSEGNTVAPNRLHSNADQITYFDSIGDDCTAGVSDATNHGLLAGVYYAGTGSQAWTHTQNHITKDVSGNFGFGSIPVSGVRIEVRGPGATSATFGQIVTDSAGLDYFACRDDKVILMSRLGNFANDAAAAAGGIPVGGLYRNSNVVMVRVV